MIYHEFGSSSCQPQQENISHVETSRLPKGLCPWPDLLINSFKFRIKNSAHQARKERLQLSSCLVKQSQSKESRNYPVDKLPQPRFVNSWQMHLHWFRVFSEHETKPHSHNKLFPAKWFTSFRNYLIPELSFQTDFSGLILGTKS